MRSITDTLLAAATSWRGRPVVRLDVRNRRPRWAVRAWEDGARYASDMLGEGGTIHRARVDGAGNLAYAQVTDPQTPRLSGDAGSWTDWVTLVGGCVAASDVALAQPAEGCLRAFYLAATTPVELRCASSADGGASWNTGNLVATVAGTVYLAAAHQRVFYIEGGLVKSRGQPWGGSSWVAGANWSALGTMATPRGLGADYDAAAGLYRVLVAGDGALWAGSYDAAADAWSDPLQIAPGGAGGAPAASALRDPAVLVAGGSYWVSWMDDLQGDPAAWTQPVVLRSQDWTHFGDEVALQISAEEHRRVALAWAEELGQVFAGDEGTICATALYDAASAAQNLVDLQPIHYARETTSSGSRLTITLLDPAGELKGLGQAGEAAEALQPLAEIILERGYRTAAGEETVALDPHYLLTAELIAGRDGGRVILEAVDGWGLLGLWRPGEPLTWEGRSIHWLLAELCARVGLSYVEEEQEGLLYEVPTFTVLPGQNGAQAARALLGLAGAVAWFDAQGALRAAELALYSPVEKPELGAAGEIAQARYGLRAPWGTTWRYYGEGVAHTSDDEAASMALGLRLVRAAEDHRLVTADQAQRAAEGAWAAGRMAARREVVTVPLRPDLELWDLALLHADEAIIPPEDDLRRIVEIAEEYDAARGRYLSRVTLERA